MTEDMPATRRELDIIREEIHRLDDHGSRGVGVLQSQITDLAKDVAELKVEMNARFEAHQRVHDQDHNDRIAGRRWLVTTGIAALVAMATVIGLLIEILTRVH